MLIDNKLHQQNFNLPTWNECEIRLNKLVFDQNLVKIIVDCIYASHKIVPSIKTQNVAELQTYGVKFKGKAEAIVNSVINKFVTIQMD